MTHSSNNSEFWQSNENTEMHLSRIILFGLQLLSRENHILSDLDIWNSGSLDLYHHCAKSQGQRVEGFLVSLLRTKSLKKLELIKVTVLLVITG